MSTNSDNADSCQNDDETRENDLQFQPPKAEQIRTTIGQVVKDNHAAVKRFKYLVDKTLADKNRQLRRDESA